MKPRSKLWEAYRPKTYNQVIGQQKVIDKLATLRPRGLEGRAYWLSGQSGTGKTTIARLIASEVGRDWTIEEIDGSKCNLAYVDEIEESLHHRPLGGGCWVWIINEAHLLAPRVIGRLLVTIETLPAYAVLIFTTTCEAQAQLFDARLDADAFLSRCVNLPLCRRNLAEGFATRAKEIAQAEGLDGKPFSYYVERVRQSRNNLRAVLQAVENGDMLT